MTGSYALDRSTASWLADLDPSLAQLPRTLPAPTGYPEWQLHDVRWSPGAGCRLAYRVRTGDAPATFVGVDVNGPQRSKRDYRADGCLPGLARATDPELVAGRLGGLMQEPVRSVRIEPVRYRPGSRCVLRYDVRTATAVTTLYAKALLPEAFDTMTSVGAFGGRGAAGAGVGGIVPPVAANWPDLHVLVVSGVTGRSASSVLADPEAPAGERTRLAFRVGGLLARFHRHAAAERALLPSCSAADQATSLAKSLAAARHADARVAERLDAAAEALSSALPALGVQVMCHGAFRAGQVIVVDDEELAVLDVDGVCSGDPERDLGTVLAHLRWQGVRLPHLQPTLRAAEDALLAGYEEGAGRVDVDALHWWRASGLLQVAARRYRRLEVAAWPLVPRLADAVDELMRERLPDRGRAAVEPAKVDPLSLEEVSPVLREALAPIASRPRELQVESAVELAAASGRRSVVRYTVRGLDDANTSAVIGKTFTEQRRARLLHDHLRMLSAGPFRHSTLRVPEPLGLLPERRLVLYRPCDGDPLDEVSAPADAQRGVRLAARWLARLHTSDVVLPRRLLLEQEAASTLEWARLVGQAYPAVAARAQRLAEGWLVAGRFAGDDGYRPIHKDFHAGHVLVGAGVCVIDLDEARQGDAALDVAHFCTYLELSAGADPSQQPLRQLFLDEYAATGVRLHDETFGPYCAYTWLKIAKQWTRGSGPGREASPAQRRDGVEQAITKGEAWLSG